MAELIKLNGKVDPTVEYLAHNSGHWVAVPACVGSQIKGPCSRIDLMKQHAGIDVLAMYPAGAPPKADAWTLDAMLKAAEACHKGGNPFGIGLGQTEDNVDTAGAIFQSFGAELVDAKGNITVKTDPVRQALEYYKKLAQFLPPDAPAWDNASNNKYLISGKGSLIMNPPSAWAVAKRDAPKVAEQLLDARHAGGSEGALRAVPAVLLGHLELRQEQDRRPRPAAAPVAARRGREDGGGERRLRSAGVREADHAQGLGRGRAAEGHALPLPEPAQSPDPVGRGATRAAEDRRADLHPGDPRPRWSCASCRASRWKRRWPGPKARSKATCGPERAPQLLPSAPSRAAAAVPRATRVADGRRGIANASVVAAGRAARAASAGCCGASRRSRS